MRTFRGVIGAWTQPTEWGSGQADDGMSAEQAVAWMEKLKAMQAQQAAAEAAPKFTSIGPTRTMYMPEETPVFPTEEPSGMSTGMIVGLAVVGVAVIGGAIYLARR